MKATKNQATWWHAQPETYQTAVKLLFVKGTTLFGAQQLPNVINGHYRPAVD